MTEKKDIRKEVYKKLTLVFRDVFDDDEIEINDKITANDIEDWDSLTHISLISSIEDEFKVKFSMKDVLQTKNVGELVDIILKQKENKK